MMEKLITLSELFKTAYRVMADNPSIIWPLVLYFIITGLIITPQAASNIIIILFMFVLSAAFIAGWYPMFHKNIKIFFNKGLKKEEKAIEYVKTYKEFFPGVENYTLSMVGVIITSIIIMLTISTITSIIFKLSLTGTNYEKILQDFSTNLSAFKANSQSFKSLLNIKYKYVYYLMAANTINILIFSYFSLFWPQSIILFSKNPLKALWESIKTAIKNPLEIIIIFFANIIGQVAILGGILLSSQNALFQILSLLATIYLLVYLAILNLLGFEKYSDKINCYHRSDSFR